MAPTCHGGGNPTGAIMKSQAFIATRPRAALRPRDAAAYLGIGLSTIWKWARRAPGFPRPHKLAPRVTVWIKDDLDAFLAQRGEG